MWGQRRFEAREHYLGQLLTRLQVPYTPHHRITHYQTTPCRRRSYPPPHPTPPHHTTSMLNYPSSFFLGSSLPPFVVRCTWTAPRVSSRAPSPCTSSTPAWSSTPPGSASRYATLRRPRRALPPPPPPPPPPPHKTFCVPSRVVGVSLVPGVWQEAENTFRKGISNVRLLKVRLSPPLPSPLYLHNHRSFTRALPSLLRRVPPGKSCRRAST